MATLFETRPTPSHRPSGPPLVVMLGPPGSGKGTQCARLVQVLGAAHVSTGDAFRDEVRRGTRLGRRVRAYLAAGELVPDGLVAEAVRGQLEHYRHAPSILLDGFPRTVTQALELGRLGAGAVRLALALVVPRVVLLRRLAGRDRSDDRVDIVRRRMASYERDTRPLVAWFAARGLLVHIDGTQVPSRVTAVVLNRLRAAGIAPVPARTCP